MFIFCYERIGFGWAVLGLVCLYPVTEFRFLCQLQFFLESRGLIFVVVSAEKEQIIVISVKFVMIMFHCCVILPCKMTNIAQWLRV